jgi:dipeptidase
VCDTLVSVSPGRVLFAKNSDRHPNEAQHLDWRPRESHDSGSALRCTWIEVEQVAATHAVLLSRPFWMWGAEMGANEHGVVVGNEAVYTDQPYAPTGLTGMDLVRLALERADTAAAGVDVVTGLLDRYGQGGGCGHEDRSATYHNSFLIADPVRAFVVETAGTLWAVEEVTSGVRSISNGLTIDGFARHAARLPTWGTQARKRRAVTQSCAAGSPAELMTVLRAHAQRGPMPRFAPLMGAKGAPCMHAGAGSKAVSQTTGSWVAELRADGDHRHWVTATSAPCTGLFKPVAIELPLDLGPDPTDRFDPTTLWWRHEVLHRTVLLDPVRLTAVYATERDALEAAWVTDPPTPAEAFAEGDAATARWTTAVRAAVGSDRRPARARRYWAVRARRAGTPDPTAAA